MKNHTSHVWKKCGYRIKTGYSYECMYPQNNKGSICRHGNNKLALENKFYDRYDDSLRIIVNGDVGHYAWSFEGLLVGVADEISQRHHDIEDGLIAKVIQLDDILDWIEQFLKPYFNNDERKLFNSLNISGKKHSISKLSKLVVGSLNRNLIENSKKNLKSFFKHFGINNRKDFEAIYPNLTLDMEFDSLDGKIQIKDAISYPSELATDEIIFKKQLKRGILNSYQVQRMDGKARFVIRRIAKAYLSNPQQMNDGTVSLFFNRCYPDKESLRDLTLGDKRAWLDKIYYSTIEPEYREILIRLICDFISGMTDDFAIIEHARLYSTSESVSLRHY